MDRESLASRVGVSFCLQLPTLIGRGEDEAPDVSGHLSPG